MTSPHRPTGHAEAEARLRRLLGDPGLSWLVDRARRRLERDRPLTGSVSLSHPTPRQRAAVERLLGRAPGSGGSLSVRLSDVDAVLRRSGAAPGGLAAAVTMLTGPVASLHLTRLEEERAWQEAYEQLEPLVRDRPALAVWAGRMRDEGLIRRLARTPSAARPLLADLARVLSALPAEPAVSLPAYAADVLGSAHALDEGMPLATLTLSGVRALTGHPDGSGAAWRRAAWASAGLLRDELSSTVLTLNLRGTPALDWAADEGEPTVLTLRQLTRHPLAHAPAQVHVCENPAVLAAAADAHGRSCRPLVCLQGQPSAAALTLLRRLHDLGATLRYHGDFDWGGLRIAAGLQSHVPWRPWRYTAHDYRAAVAATTAAGDPLSPLTGIPFASAADEDLVSDMTERGLRVEEETLLDTLLADLSPGEAVGGN